MNRYEYLKNNQNLNDAVKPWAVYIKEKLGFDIFTEEPPAVDSNPTIRSTLDENGEMETEKEVSSLRIPSTFS